MKTIFLIVLILGFYCSSGQNYNISFTASGESNFIDSIHVKFHKFGTQGRLSGIDTLFLLNTGVGVGIITNSIKENDLNVYPNPVKDNAVIEYSSLIEEIVNIEIYDLYSKLIKSEKFYVLQGKSKFKLSGLGSGIFIINFRSQSNNLSTKIISLSSATNSASVKLRAIGFNSTPSLKSNKTNYSSNIVTMEYGNNIWLKLTAYSGDFISVCSILPIKDTTVNFEFVSCPDGEGKNYASCKINNQFWMAENLRFLPYINNVSVGSEDKGKENDKCYYVANYQGSHLASAKNTLEYKTYGVLYNWNAAMNGEESSDSIPSGVQGVCPSGWHLPSNNEWLELIEFLGPKNGDKLQEAYTSHWENPSSHNDTNETGFSALGGGMRHTDGIFSYIRMMGFFWSTFEYSSENAWFIYMTDRMGSAIHPQNEEFYKGGRSKSLGKSVRCIKNNE